MATFTLTTGTDIFVGGPEDDTVTGTDVTLNSSDSLTGGGGNDTLALYEGVGGDFHVDQLANFTGFENITLNDGGVLYLGSQTLVVTGFGSVDDILYLGSGATTFQGGSGKYNLIYSSSPSNWNAGDVINGGLLRSANLYLDQSGLGDATYDLTTNTLTNIDYLIANEFGNALNLTLKINSADAAGVSIFYSNNPGMNDRLVTSDATLDLSHSLVSGFTIVSTNASGTTFVVHNLSTADLIRSTTGLDTVLASGFSFTALDRNYIFYYGGIGKIIDSTGTYTPDGIVSGGPTIDALVGQPVSGSAIEVIGTGAADDTVTLYADGGTTPVGTGTVAADDSFDITTSTAFAGGSHTLIATQINAAGVISTTSASFLVAVDPSAPTINTLVGQVNGSLAEVVEVKGTGEAGDTVTLYADGGTTSLGTGVVAANGSFDIATTVTFAGGSPTLTATQTDAQDLTSTASTSFAVAFDPNAPAISALAGQPVNDAPVEVKGTGEAGDTVILYADGDTSPVGTGAVASNGSFDITTSTTFVDGLHSLTATLIDAQGLTNTVSASFSVKVDPSAPVISTLMGQPVSGSPIAAKGTGQAGDTVTLYADGGPSPVGTGAVASNGSFDITTNVTFADGSHTLTATQADAAGLTSPASASFAFAVGAAVVSAVAAPGSGDFNAGDKFTITLDMNEAVKVVGKPTLALNDGGTASYNATLSSPTALVFTYTVAAAQNALELEITGVNLPSGASIKDSQGNNADLSGAVANLGLQIDTTQPTVSNIVASPSTALAFDYTVATGQNTSDLQLTGVNLPSGTAIQDLAGNKAILSRVTADLGLQIDTKPPTVTKVLASPSTGDLNAGNTVSITLDMSEPVTVKGTPTLALNDGGIATYNLAASTSTSLVFDYLVSAGENTTALKVTGVNLGCGSRNSGPRWQ
jgi:Bacterial Ig-like domain/Bacterial Ig domain